ncbi:MAG: FAD-dependent monooxygenase [Pseudomonadota bacterium]
MSSSATDYDVLIAGSGLAGLAMAASLTVDARGLRIAIAAPDVEIAHPGEQLGLRVSAITPASARLFSTVDAWHSMPATHCQPFASMRVWDAATDCGDGICFDAAQFTVPALGYIVDNAMLRWQLFDVLSRHPTVDLLGARITALRHDDRAVHATTDSGESVTARLLIGADGRGSRIRSLAGITVKGWDHDQTAVVAHLVSELVHERCALQRFLPNGPMALLPLAADRVSLVLSTTPEHAADLQAASTEEFNAEVSALSDHVLGRLSLDSERAAFPLVSQYALDPVAPRTALIGDAAHAIHPLAGQGANLGFGDVQALSMIVASAQRNGADIGDAPLLRRFRRMRKTDNLGMLYGLDLINRLFARSDGRLADLRRLGMRWFARNTMAKQLAASHAMGVRPEDGAPLERRL